LCPFTMSCQEMPPRAFTKLEKSRTFSFYLIAATSQKSYKKRSITAFLHTEKDRLRVWCLS
jgi:hypothetical protein